MTCAFNKYIYVYQPINKIKNYYLLQTLTIFFYFALEIFLRPSQSILLSRHEHLYYKRVRKHWSFNSYCLRYSIVIRLVVVSCRQTEEIFKRKNAITFFPLHPTMECDRPRAVQSVRTLNGVFGCQTHVLSGFAINARCCFSCESVSRTYTANKQIQYYVMFRCRSDIRPELWNWMFSGPTAPVCNFVPLRRPAVSWLKKIIIITIFWPLYPLSISVLCVWKFLCL